MTVKDGGLLSCDTVQFCMWMSDLYEVLPPSWVCLLLEDGVTGSSESLATTYCTTAFRKPGKVNLTVTCSLFL